MNKWFWVGITTAITGDILLYNDVVGAWAFGAMAVGFGLAIFSIVREVQSIKAARQSRSS